MSDAQLASLLAAILTFAGSIATAIRWGVVRLVNAIDHSSTVATAALDRSTNAIIANTASNAVLVTKLDNLADKVDEIGSFVEDYTPVGPAPSPARSRNSRGFRGPRPGSHHDPDQD